MICLLARRRLGAYVDGALDPRVRVALRQHLAACVHCRREVDGLAHVKALILRGLPVLAEPDWTGFWPGIVRGIQDSPGRTSIGVRRPWPRRWALGAAVAAVATLTLVVVYPGLTPDGPDDPVVVTAADTQYPGGTMVYHTPEKMAVVWVFDD